LKILVKRAIYLFIFLKNQIFSTARNKLKQISMQLYVLSDDEAAVLSKPIARRPRCSSHDNDDNDDDNDDDDDDADADNADDDDEYYEF